MDEPDTPSCHSSGPPGHFLKKSAFLVNLISKMDSLTHLHSRNVYFYIHYSNSLKVTALHMFQNNLDSHPRPVPSKCTKSAQENAQRNSLLLIIENVRVDKSIGSAKFGRVYSTRAKVGNGKNVVLSVRF